MMKEKRSEEIKILVTPAARANLEKGAALTGKAVSLLAAIGASIYSQQFDVNTGTVAGPITSSDNTTKEN